MGWGKEQAPNQALSSLGSLAAGATLGRDLLLVGVVSTCQMDGEAWSSRGCDVLGD